MISRADLRLYGSGRQAVLLKAERLMGYIGRVGGGMKFWGVRTHF